MEINIESLVRERVEEMDLGRMVRDEIRAIVGKEVREHIAAAVKEQVNAIIGDAIAEIMAGPTTTDDGWGNRKEFPAFEDLFKKAFLEKMNQTWDIKRTIEQKVNERVSSLINQRYMEVITKIVDGISGTVVVPKATQ